MCKVKISDMVKTEWSPHFTADSNELRIFEFDEEARGQVIHKPSDEVRHVEAQADGVRTTSTEGQAAQVSN
jgi:RecB family exonuclease